jgi:hypothetical protein
MKIHVRRITSDQSRHNRVPEWFVAQYSAIRACLKEAVEVLGGGSGAEVDFGGSGGQSLTEMGPTRIGGTAAAARTDKESNVSVAYGSDEVAIGLGLFFVCSSGHGSRLTAHPIGGPTGLCEPES